MNTVQISLYACVFLSVCIQFTSYSLLAMLNTFENKCAGICSVFPQDKAIRLWILRSDQQRHSKEEVTGWNSILDGSRGHFKNTIWHKGKDIELTEYLNILYGITFFNRKKKSQSLDCV